MKRFASIFFAAAVIAVAANPAPVFAAEAVASKDVALWRQSGIVPTWAAHQRFRPFAGDARAGSIAAGDLGSDGTHELIVGSGFQEPPLVRVLRADGSEILAFAPFDAGMLQGVHVAMGDLDGDGKAEIVAGAGSGAAAHVRVFDNMGKEAIFPGGFFPFGREFRGGVSLAVADLDGDGRAEIITGAGPTGGPHVKAWRGDGVLLSDFFAFDNHVSSGLNLAAGDLDGDGKAEIVAAIAGGSHAYVRMFSGTQGARVGEFLAIGGGFSGGLNLAAGDLDGDGRAEIVAAPNGEGGPHVHVFDGTGKLRSHFFAYEEAYRGGVLPTVGKFSADAPPSLVVAPAERTISERPHLPQYITVDISEQRLRAFEFGRLTRTFLVTTGERRFPTPIGEFSILDKPYKVNYKWSYGPNHPENYDLGWVTWNLRFYPHVYIHYAPWRRVFGVRGSHGCVNVSKTNAQWIYEWADVGTPVTVQE